MQIGANHNKASELRVDRWIDASGSPLDKPVRLADMGEGYKIIYCFQHWCSGCHSSGFPTLKYLHNNLTGKGFEFAVIQTVFEGGDVNTADKLRINQEQYNVQIPFGHDVPPNGKIYPTFMEDYRSGGTPWFTVIDPAGNVVFADFQLDPGHLIRALCADDGDLK